MIFYLSREVVILVNKEQKPGNYKVLFDASVFPSGVCYCQIKLNNPDFIIHLIETKKIIFKKFSP